MWKKKLFHFSCPRQTSFETSETIFIQKFEQTFAPALLKENIWFDDAFARYHLPLMRVFAWKLDRLLFINQMAQFDFFLFLKRCVCILTILRLLQRMFAASKHMKLLHQYLRSIFWVNLPSYLELSVNLMTPTPFGRPFMNWPS